MGWRVGVRWGERDGGNDVLWFLGLVTAFGWIDDSGALEGGGLEESI